MLFNDLLPSRAAAADAAAARESRVAVLAGESR